MRINDSYLKVLLTFLNCYSVKWVSRVQNVFSAGKIIALLIIVAFGAYAMVQGN
jgi:amino acid transporter